MKKKYRIAIVGSGPAAVAAAYALVGSGHQIEMLDFGNEPEQKCKELANRLRTDPTYPADLRLLKNGLSSVTQSKRRSWPAQAIKSLGQIFTPRTPANMNNKKIFGSEYVFRDIDTYLPLAAGSPQIPRSLARGGLSNVWGAACYPFGSYDLEDWPIGTEDMAEHFATIKNILGISEKHDLLENSYEIHGAESAALKLNPQAENLLLHWHKNRDKLEAAGFDFGQSRLAALTRSRNDRMECQYCGLCLYGCPYGSIYNTSYTLEELQLSSNFRYLPGIFVHSFKESQGKVAVRGLDVKNDRFSSFEYDKLLIGAGVLSTVRIVCESLNENGNNIQLLDNAMLIMPLLKIRDWKPLDPDVKFTLSQLVLVSKNDAICNRRIQMQFYSYSDYIVDRLSPIIDPLPSILKRLAKKWLFNTFMMFGYLDGKYSPTIRVRLVPQGSGMPAILACEYGENANTDLIIRKLVADLKSVRHALNLYPLYFALKKGEPGFSGHISGGLSMKKDPTFLQTHTNGMLRGCKAVHIIDQSTFPSLPAQNSTYTAMANAHRIATDVRRLCESES